MPDRDDSDEAKARRRRLSLARTRRWRSRCRRKVELFAVEADGQLYDMAVRFGGLKESQIDNKDQVAAALGRLLRAGITLLLEKEALKKL